MRSFSSEIILDHFQQARISAENVLAHVRAGFHGELLRFAINHFAQTLDEKAVNILFEERIPIGPPENLDAVPTGAAECRFEFLNDFAIAADGPIEPLQIAIDDENKVVEFFAGCERDGARALPARPFRRRRETPTPWRQQQASRRDSRDSG